MPKELRHHKSQIESTIEAAGAAVKDNLLAYLREKLPILPKYNEFSSGFQEAYGVTNWDVSGLRSGLRITGGWTFEHPLIVLEEGGMFEVPFKMTDGKMQPDWSAMQEVGHLGYQIYSSKALEEINRWAQILEKKSPLPLFTVSP